MIQKINPDLIRLNDILQAITDIEDYKLTKLTAKKDIHAVCYNIALIGEAARLLSPELKKNNPEIPWPQITGIRNKVIHEYGKVDVLILQDVITDKLPGLKRQIAGILDSFRK